MYNFNHLCLGKFSKLVIWKEFCIITASKEYCKELKEIKHETFLTIYLFVSINVFFSMYSIVLEIVLQSKDTDQ